MKQHEMDDSWCRVKRSADIHTGGESWDELYAGRKTRCVKPVRPCVGLVLHLGLWSRMSFALPSSAALWPIGYACREKLGSCSASPAPGFDRNMKHDIEIASHGSTTVFQASNVQILRLSDF